MHDNQFSLREALRLAPRKGVDMSVPSSIHRSPERSVQVAFRVTPGDRQVLRDKAASLGMTLQDYLTWKALELDTPPKPLPDGRRPRLAPTSDSPLFEERMTA